MSSLRSRRDGHFHGWIWSSALAEKYPDLIGAVAAISPAKWTSYEQAKAVNAAAYASATDFAEDDAVTHAAASPTRRSGWPGATMIRFIPAWLLLRERCLLPRDRVLAGLPHRLLLCSQEPPSLQFLGQSPQQWTEFRPPPPYVQDPPEPNSLTPPFGPPFLTAPGPSLAGRTGGVHLGKSPGRLA